MKEIRFGRSAIAEMLEDFAVYEEQLVGRGVRFRDAVEAAAALIGRHPRIGTPYRGGYRKRLIRGFPHLIFYFEYPDYVWIQAVHHGHRKPDTWLDRELPSDTDEIE